MGNVRLAVGCSIYDRTEPLATGRVKAEGIELEWTELPLPELFFRMLQKAEFDVAEMSLSNYSMLVSRGEAPFIAIPVFPSRMFRHGNFFVRKDAGIVDARGLRGKRLGVPEFTMTAIIWARGMLKHDYGVEMNDIHWFTGGLTKDRRKWDERISYTPPKGVTIDRLPPDSSLDDAIRAGDLDAVFTVENLPCFEEGHPDIRRLWPDFRSIEEDYFRRTGYFPIMHTVVIRNEVYEANPWIARSLYDAFLESKRLVMERLRYTGALRATLPWLSADVERTRQIMGEDYWPYGVKANRRTVEALETYLVEQGMCERKVDIEELFARETLDT